jgi:hypothetical protein
MLKSQKQKRTRSPQLRAIEFAQEKPLSISRNHAYLAGIITRAGGDASELDNCRLRGFMYLMFEVEETEAKAHTHPKALLALQVFMVVVTTTENLVWWWWWWW